MTNTLENITVDIQYNNIADAFQDADEKFPDVTRPILYGYIDKMDLSGKNALDIGCGYGEDVAYLASKGAKAHGIDISDKMVELTKKKCPQADAKVAPMENLPYKSSSFKLVYSRYAVQHSANMEAVFEEVSRVLETDGEFLFLVTHPIRHYFEKKTKDYWKQEDVESSILGGKVVVREPSHTMSEYFSSPALKKTFKLLDVQELHDPAAQQMPQYGKYPCVMIMHYKKI